MPLSGLACVERAPGPLVSTRLVQRGELPETWDSLQRGLGAG